MSMLLPGNRQI